MTLDDLDDDLRAIVADIVRDRTGLNHVEVTLDGCILRTRSSWSHMPLVVETQLPLDLVTGPEGWHDAPSPPAVEDKALVTLHPRPERATNWPV